MKIHHALEPRASDARPLVLAIGFFDGFHRGHQAIVRALLRRRKPGYRAAVLTFSNHPSTHLRPDKTPALISTVGERVNALANAGIDELYLASFDARIATLDARTFVEDILVERLRVRALVIGENFRFGAGRTGDATLASELLAAHGTTTVAVPPVLDDDDRVSSTRIRAAIARGDLAVADRLLGEPYVVRGIVELGEGRGHDLGFPTANLVVPPEKSLPRDGVYTVVGRHDGRTYPGLVSIGTNPTFDGRRRTVEAWLLDFKRTVYGEELALREFRFVREQKRFATVDELLVQMREDATHVRFPSFSLT